MVHSTASLYEQPIEKLRTAFQEAGCDGAHFTSLGIEDFVATFHRLFHIEEDHLRVLFKRVDANANGKIDWDELSNFLLLNSTIVAEQKNLSTEVDRAYAETYKEFPSQGGQDPTRWVEHQDTINHIVVHPRYPRYITGGQDGAVKVWHSGSLTHERTIHNGTVWITDLLYIPPHLSFQTDCIVASSLDRLISVYDATTGDLVKTYKGGKGKKRLVRERKEVTYREEFVVPHRHQREAEPEEVLMKQRGKVEGSSTLLSHFRKKREIGLVVMENLERIPWALGHYSSLSRDMLLVGTDDGSIFTYDITRELHNDGVLSVPCMNSSNDGPGWATGHTGAITKLLAIPSMESIVTAGADCTLRILSLDRGTQLRQLGDASRIMHEKVVHDYGHRKPVHTFSWCDERKLIASCGMERDVLIWNPFITKPITKLVGHRTPMVDVAFNHADHQLITLSTDKVVKVWDIRMFLCMQTLVDTARYRPENRLGAIAYDQRQGCIVTGSTRLHVRQLMRNVSGYGASYRGHRTAVVSAVYSQEFNQVVSADDQRVVVWDVDTKQLVVSWSVPQGITHLSLDPHERRLLMGTRSGDTLIWNYITAHQLNTCVADVIIDEDTGRKRKVDQLAPAEYPIPVGVLGKAGSTEVNHVQYTTVTKPTHARYIVSLQGNRRLLCYDDSPEDQLPFSRLVCFGDELRGVFSTAFTPPNTFLFGTGCGSIAVLRLNQGMRPVLLPRLPVSRALHQSLFDGPVHRGFPPYVEKAWEHKVNLDLMDNLIESVVVIQRTGSVAAACHGDGMISFWHFILDEGKGHGELFSFLAAHRLGEALMCLCLGKDEMDLFAGDAGGHVYMYDISAIGSNPATISPMSVSRVRTFRVATQAITHLSFMANIGMLLVGSLDARLSIVSTEGYTAVSFGHYDSISNISDPSTWTPPMDPSPPMQAAQARFRGAWLVEYMLEWDIPSIQQTEVIALIKESGHPRLFSNTTEKDIVRMLAVVSQEGDGTEATAPEPPLLLYTAGKTAATADRVYRVNRAVASEIAQPDPASILDVRASGERGVGCSTAQLPLLACGLPPNATPAQSTKMWGSASQQGLHATPRSKHRLQLRLPDIDAAAASESKPAKLDITAWRPPKDCPAVSDATASTSHPDLQQAIPQPANHTPAARAPHRVRYQYPTSSKPTTRGHHPPPRIDRLRPYDLYGGKGWSPPPDITASAGQASSPSTPPAVDDTATRRPVLVTCENGRDHSNLQEPKADSLLSTSASQPTQGQETAVAYVRSSSSGEGNADDPKSDVAATGSTGTLKSHSLEAPPANAEDRPTPPTPPSRPPPQPGPPRRSRHHHNVTNLPLRALAGLTLVKPAAVANPRAMQRDLLKAQYSVIPGVQLSLAEAAEALRHSDTQSTSSAAAPPPVSDSPSKTKKGTRKR